MRRLVAVAALGLAMTLSACDTSSYAFKVDKSIDITVPKARATVGIPLLVTWTDEKAPTKTRVAPGDPKADYYAVFLDRAAMPPNKRLSSLIKGTVKCSEIKGCPTKTQLEEIGVYLVAKPSLSIEFVRDLRATTRGDSKDVHEVTVVRMRGDRRFGETAYLQTFFVRR